MPITRTPIIDDDGTGTTGTVIDNAWKQELYDQIDAYGAGFVAPVSGVWTPADASGAGLAFTGASGIYTKNGRLVFLAGQLNFPATANASGVTIGGLPFATDGQYGIPPYFTNASFAGTIFLLTNPPTSIFAFDGTGSAIPNSAFSGKALRFSGVYRTT